MAKRNYFYFIPIAFVKYFIVPKLHKDNKEHAHSAITVSTKNTIYNPVVFVGLLNLDLTLLRLIATLIQNS